MTLLGEIQETAQEVAEAIATVLNVDVTVVDQSLRRVAGTGQYRAYIGQTVRLNSVFETVLNTGESFFLRSPREDAVCGTCTGKASCAELAEVCCPIKLGTVTIGVIALIAFSEEQRKTLLDQPDNLRRFIAKMADLIASKAAEKEHLNRLLVMKSQLETVINAVHEGLVAVDYTGRVTHVNASAERILNMGSKDVFGAHLDSVFEGASLSDVLACGRGVTNREISCRVKGKRVRYVVSTSPIMDGEKVRGAVVTLREMGEIRKFVTQLQGGNMPWTFDMIIGESAALKEAKALAEKAAAHGATVLIYGESGTGKELFARAIHYAGPRRHKPLLAINCAAIPEALLESELFGYEEGAFTGAKKGGKPGKFELADGGTVFLDEIGDMSLKLQAKLLRVLQERQIERIGGTEAVPINVRVIAATHKNLEKMVAEGEFREDLYYRLNVIPLYIPALKERREDIPLLLRHFLAKYREITGKPLAGFSPDALDALLNYPWPGNVRELENAVEYAASMETTDVVQKMSLPARISTGVKGRKPSSVRLLAELEREAICAALEQYGATTTGKTRAAEALGISRATLYRKLKAYQLDITQNEK